MAVLATSCTPTKPGPVAEPPVIQSITPTAGPSTGGTEVTIRGSGFAAGATVAIGGQAAGDVRIQSADVIIARTPASTIAGAVDITVTVSGRPAVLTSGFRYELTAPNTAPVFRSLTAQGLRPRQPASFADYGETIRIALVVEDAESAPGQLVYQWQACDGTFSGTGPQVDWTSPSGATLPSTCNIQVTVTDGPHVLTWSIVVRLHNSVAEVSALALEFLEEFANSLIPAETTVRNFSDSCPGKAAELGDVTNNRALVRINSHTYGTPAVTVAFMASGSACKSRSTTVDACALTSVEWKSTRIGPPPLEETVTGTSTISGVYRDSRWWLCDSGFDGKSSLGLHFLD